MQPHRFLRAVFLIVLVGALRIPVRAGPPQAPPASPDSPAFREFTQRVQQYVKLQKDGAASTDHQTAQRNRRAPAGARAEDPGDALKRQARRHLHSRSQRGVSAGDSKHVSRSQRAQRPQDHTPGRTRGGLAFDRKWRLSRAPAVDHGSSDSAAPSSPATVRSCLPNHRSRFRSGRHGSQADH